MSENLLLFSLLAVVIILILLLILRQQKYTHLHQELSKTTQDYNQLASKFDELSSIKNQFEQQTIKVQTENQGLQYRLTERDEQIHHLTQERQNLTEKLTALSQELTGLQTTLTEKEKYFSAQQQNFEQSKLQLSVEFQNLANRILDEKSRSFSQSNQTALETLLKPFREQIEGFQKRVNEIHSESVKGNAGLEAEIKKVLEIGLNMSQEASNLTSALKGEKKTLGNWGEVQLERALQLAGLEENVHYRTQAHFKDEQGGRNYPDFVLNLPDEKHLIIDSKMSLVAYENAVNSEDDFERERLLKEHISALKTHINDLHKKDYSNLIGMCSPNFVLMFIAVEPAYIEALKADPALFNYGYERNVIMVSHTTLMPILRTVANLWRIERGNAEAKEIAEKAGEIYNQICLVAERLNKLGNTLSTVSNQYNSTVTALVGQQGLVGKVERFKTLSAKANKTMPDVDLLNNQLDLARLNVLNQENLQ
ncbi:TPA: DNA recombination protein RmuC [Haemophilus influenzae]|uniref:DNA recombination protein RmuC n=1 Tax=Haemophilus influenzae TaxID=727 RepID=UPI003F78F640